MNESRLTRNLAVSSWCSENLKERTVMGAACRRLKRNAFEAKIALTRNKVDAVQTLPFRYGNSHRFLKLTTALLLPVFQKFHFGRNVKDLLNTLEGSKVGAFTNIRAFCLKEFGLERSCLLEGESGGNEGLPNLNPRERAPP
ncbi:hypothetical protein AVEN_89902-1 [Araneus ventricosus]|uniref:Uncharacterized protein n=1 Tax=Araneus ventricosus TaxID=182803 RepID=A0A4Y2N0Z9_ARAVE|nr:hypothetical protein AVEN_89902-1 [Araneus ventricosus]